MHTLDMVFDLVLLVLARGMGLFEVERTVSYFVVARGNGSGGCLCLLEVFK
jgi:hypothetical protein